MRDYIKNGWANNLVDPDHDNVSVADHNSDSSAPTNALITVNPEQSTPLIVNNWKSLKEAFTCSEEVPSFSHGQIVTYFVSRTVCDGLPAGDFKAINANAKKLFDCGHVQNIEVGTHNSLTWVSLPEMKKNVVYKLVISLNTKYDIEIAKCGCKAGKGPKGSCKHIGALCYALAQFCSSGRFSNLHSKITRMEQAKATKIRNYTCC